MAGTYDDGESYDAADLGEDIVPEWVVDFLRAELLEELKEAGF